MQVAIANKLIDVLRNPEVDGRRCEARVSTSKRFTLESTKCNDPRPGSDHYGSSLFPASLKVVSLSSPDGFSRAEILIEIKSVFVQRFLYRFAINFRKKRKVIADMCERQNQESPQ